MLVLLPTRTEKLLAKWKGPYKVLRKVGRVNYEIEVPGGRKEKKLFHVNMLKPWTNPEENFVNYIPDEQDELPCFVRDVQQGKSDLKLGESLSEVEKKQMTKLIGEFPMLTRLQPGKTRVIEHRINTDAQGPVHQRAYRIPPALKTEVVEELKELLDAGVVEESTSEWSSPIVVVKKKDGTNRICVDYRKLNATSKFDAYPKPRIDEMLDAVGQSEYLTTLDLTKGYWQVPMKEEDKTKTAFSSPLGLLQFTVMPFGLSRAPATFQRMMDQVLRGTEGYAGVYLDDIIIFGNTWEEHLSNVKQVFQRLQDAGLTIKLKKCNFGVGQCTYLGHKIG